MHAHTHTHTHTHNTHNTHTHTHTHTQLKEMEQERIAELGTTLGKSGTEGKGRHRLASGAGDLLSSAKLCCDHAPDSADFGKCN